MKDITVTLIEKYLSGTASPEEKAKVEALYQSCLDRPFPFDPLEEPERKQISEKMWLQISGVIAATKEQEQDLPVKI